MSTKKTPLLSVIIPTRNRVNYAKSAIQAILRISSDDLQLVVEDNSDTTELADWVNNRFDDERLIYHYSDIPISMSENYERAMTLASGEYICFIGDDDGVNPEIIEAVMWAKNFKLDALVVPGVINYVWPDLQLKSRGSMEAGELSVRNFSGTITFVDPEEELLKCVRAAGQNFYKLPRSYYGVVKKQCADQVKAMTGLYFPGVSPDMSAAISIASYAKNICHVDYPLFIPGSSVNSNAGLSGLKKHIGMLKDQKHLSPTVEQDWSKFIPNFYSVQTIWAEAVVEALIATDRIDLLKKFNFSLLYANCSVFHFKYMKKSAHIFYNALAFTGQNQIYGTMKFIGYYAYLWSIRFLSLASRLLGLTKSPNIFTILGLNNIDAATLSLKDYLSNSTLRFGDVFK